jgi:hypothetical protein
MVCCEITTQTNTSLVRSGLHKQQAAQPATNALGSSSSSKSGRTNRAQASDTLQQHSDGKAFEALKRKLARARDVPVSLTACANHR